MKRFLFLFLFPILVSAQTTTQYWDFLLPHEGYREVPYTVNGIWHIGLGHRMLPGERFGVYTKEEVLEIFIRDIENAVKITKDIFPSFDKQPERIRLILVSLSYNMGRVGISKFIRFRSAIEKYDYESATKELKNSLWYNQVRNRAEDYISVVKEFS